MALRLVTVGGSIHTPTRGVVVGTTAAVPGWIGLVSFDAVVFGIVFVVVVVVVVVVAILLLVTVADIENLAPRAVVASILNVFEPFCHRAVSTVISKPVLLS
jgi:hypothetical protein